jgi:D-aminopeptidase
MERIRARELGLVREGLPPGEGNSITDVEGVLVGHTTLRWGDGSLCPGKGPVRTGVTVILPHGGNLFRQKVRGAVHRINGFGKPFGFEQVRELGTIEAPLALTNTLNVGLVADGLVQYAISQSPEIQSVNVVVGETNDSFLNDVQGRHVRAEHVWGAIETASSGPVEEGVIGAGTGTGCFGWKGGIGTASRVLPSEAGGFTLGALVQTNYGVPRDLVVKGVPVGELIQPPGVADASATFGGSVMVVLATDAPLTSRQLTRMSVRAAAGLARTGSHYGHGSGDFVIAFSTAYRIEQEVPSLIDCRDVLVDERRVIEALFRAVAEGVEEAVLNSLCKAETVVGRDGHTRHALPVAEVASLLI